MQQAGAKSRDLWQVERDHIHVLPNFNVRLTNTERYKKKIRYLAVGSRTIGCLKTSVRCCMAERYCKQFWQHGNPVPRSCHADQPSQERYDHTCHPFGIAASQWY
ncbi:hypothetical protein N5E89_08985 [Comamonas aquatica]|uniref:hypothetical protein n=1 Tax=Comamonas aquatica TaxID=225991 RepID=UPI00244AC7D5|nr:hypothetical protein [Comamonas aquatica]MDH1428450.1 hypothetical protein [Comamonas aquatica]